MLEQRPATAPTAAPRIIGTPRRLGLITVVVTGMLLSLLGVGAAGQAAQADTAPPSASTTATVSADVLPTVQVDGVVWSQVIVANTVYVTGQFTSARPAGAAAGTSETPRANLLAYNLSTGALVTSWAPSLNAQGLAIAASSDGAKIFVAGDFTQVSGLKRYRIVELDATTGAVVAGFAPVLDARARALSVIGNTVYTGGIFSTASGQPRSRLAAFNTTTGTLLPWAPTANAEVMAMTAAAPGSIVVGGRFTTLAGQNVYGMGALDTTTGAGLPWAATSTVRNAGTASAIYSLTTDGKQVYGTGYTYGQGGNFEGSFAASLSGGNLAWVTGCRGDTYSAAAAAGVLYIVSHTHDCSSIGGNPQTFNPWTYQRAQAMTTTPAADGRVNDGGNFDSMPAPELLHWEPTLSTGSYTGQNQAAWSVAANSQYVVLGGEFPKINGIAQQGLARFAIRSIAPNKEGPQGYTELGPTLTGGASGVVTASWQAAWDRDNTRLSYELLRGATLSNAVTVATQTLDTSWWARPKMTLTDSTATPASSATYRVRVTDPLGNVVVGPSAVITVPGTPPVVTQPAPPVGTQPAPPAAGVLATDAFTRTVTSGFGTADSGGSWTQTGSGTTSSVADGAARLSVPAGRQTSLLLSGVSSSATDLLSSVWLEQAPTGGGAYVAISPRSTSAIGTEYRARLKFLATGAVQIGLTKVLTGTETALGSAVTVPGLSYTAGTKLNLRVQATGISPTTLRARVWVQGSTEPAGWQVSTTDSTSDLQTTGSVSLYTYQSSSATSPVVARFDDLMATAL